MALYDLYDLGTLPGDTSSSANSLNSRGEVVGWSAFGWPFNPTRAFHWENGVMTDLGIGTSAEAINDAGVVVGYVTGKNGRASAAQWTKASGWVDLGLGDDSYAYGINDKGSIVGQIGLNSSSQAFFRTNSGNVQIIPIPMGHSGWAGGVNRNDQVTGTLSHNSGGLGIGPDTSFFWDSAVPQNLQTLPVTSGTQFSSKAINSAGLIAGNHHDDHGFVWKPGNPVLELDTLPGDRRSLAFGINDANTIVGWSEESGPQWSPRGVVWFSPSTTSIDFNLLVDNNRGMQLTSCSDINDTGVVGDGLINGYSHGFLALRRFVYEHPARQGPSVPHGQAIRVITGAAGGELIGITMDGHIIHIPEPNPIMRAVERMKATLLGINNPEIRQRTEAQFAKIIGEMIDQHKID